MTLARLLTAWALALTFAACTPAAKEAVKDAAKDASTNK